MRQYNKILAVIEPRRDQQVALKRALELAKYNPRAEIIALRLVYDFSYDIHILNRMSEQSTREDVLKTSLDHLKVTIADAAGDSKTKIIPRTAFTRDIGEGILAEAEHSGCDIIIKAANHHKVLDSILFTPIDWYILRNAKVPVIIAKEHEWTVNGSIVVAVDFSFSGRRAANVMLLREAQELARITGAPIHLVNSAPVVLPAVMLEVPHYSPEIYAQSIVKEHERRLYEFARLHGIPKENCHIKEGMPDEVIPSACNELNAFVVFLGSAGRSGMMAALIGNTCEQVVDYIKGDLIVVNDKAMAAREGNGGADAKKEDSGKAE